MKTEKLAQLFSTGNLAVKNLIGKIFGTPVAKANIPAEILADITQERSGPLVQKLNRVQAAKFLGVPIRSIIISIRMGNLTEHSTEGLKYFLMDELEAVKDQHGTELRKSIRQKSKAKIKLLKSR
jgi:hypothetical protein